MWFGLGNTNVVTRQWLTQTNGCFRRGVQRVDLEFCKRVDNATEMRWGVCISKRYIWLNHPRSWKYNSITSAIVLAWAFTPFSCFASLTIATRAVTVTSSYQRALYVQSKSQRVNIQPILILLSLSHQHIFFKSSFSYLLLFMTFTLKRNS